MERIEAAWRETPIVWLSGVRRSGKTTLADCLGAERAYYVNCDLPTVEDRVRDPVVFFQNCPKLSWFSMRSISCAILPAS